MDDDGNPHPAGGVIVKIVKTVDQRKAGVGLCYAGLPGNSSAYGR
jgi:hypothetical protein